MKNHYKFYEMALNMPLPKTCLTEYKSSFPQKPHQQILECLASWSKNNCPPNNNCYALHQWSLLTQIDHNKIDLCWSLAKSWKSDVCISWQLRGYRQELRVKVIKTDKLAESGRKKWCFCGAKVNACTNQIWAFNCFLCFRWNILSLEEPKKNNSAVKQKFKPTCPITRWRLREDFMKFLCELFLLLLHLDPLIRSSTGRRTTCVALEEASNGVSGGYHMS